MDSLVQMLRIASGCSVHFVPSGLSETTQADWSNSGLFVASIELSDVEDVRSLVEALIASIRIPEYTGHNFDALDDSLMDVPDEHPGCILFAFGATEFWQRNPALVSKFTSSWIYGAEFWARSGRPFHLIYVV